MYCTRQHPVGLPLRKLLPCKLADGSAHTRDRLRVLDVPGVSYVVAPGGRGGSFNGTNDLCPQDPIRLHG